MLSRHFLALSLTTAFLCSFAHGEPRIAKFISEMNRPKPSPEFLKSLVNFEGIDQKKAYADLESSFAYLKKKGVSLEHSGVYTLIIRNRSLIGLLRVYSVKPFKIIVNERDIETPNLKETFGSLRRFATLDAPKRNLFSKIFLNEAFAQGSGKDLTFKQDSPDPESLDDYRDIVLASLKRVKSFYILGEIKSPNVAWYDSPGGARYTGNYYYHQNGFPQQQIVQDVATKPQYQLRSRYGKLLCSPNKSDQGAIAWLKEKKPTDPPLVLRKDVLRVPMAQTEYDYYGADVRLRPPTPQESIKFSKMKDVPEPDQMHRFFVVEAKPFNISKQLKDGRPLPGKMTTDELEKAMVKLKPETADWFLLKAFSICCLDQECRQGLRRDGVDFSLTSEPETKESDAPAPPQEPNPLIKVNGDPDLRDPRFSPDTSL